MRIKRLKNQFTIVLIIFILLTISLFSKTSEKNKTLICCEETPYQLIDEKIEGDLEQKRIIFDETNLALFRITSNPYNLDYYYLASLLRNKGYIVERIDNVNDFNQTTFDNCDLFVIPAPYFEYTTSEINLILNYYQTGGNILIICDYNRAGAAQLANQFGFQISTLIIQDRDDFDGQYPYCQNIILDSGNIQSHNISENVLELYLSEACGIINKPENASDIFNSDNDNTAFFSDFEINTDLENVANNVSIMSIINNNNSTGRIGLIADGTLWSSESYYGYYMQNYLDFANNRRLASNTFKWLMNKNSELTIDTDKDNLTDYYETFVSNTNIYTNDTDSDGLFDAIEIECGANPNLNDTDTDLISDFDEVMIYNTSPSNNDSDQDKLTDYFEIFILHSDPNKEDSDQDEIPDLFEFENGMNLTDSRDAQLDFDGDNLTNLQEYRFWTDLNDPDTDNDTLTDYEEKMIYSTNPRESDSDHDNLTDAEELFTYFTNPIRKDTDGDGYSDFEEITLGSNPSDPESTPETPYPSDYPSYDPTTVILSDHLVSIILLVLFLCALILRLKKMVD